MLFILIFQFFSFLFSPRFAFEFFENKVITNTNIHTHNMWPKAVNLLVIVLLSSSLTSGLRRKSKIDLPIANAADAPPNDNIALASSNDEQQSTKFEEPSAQALANTDKPVNSAASLPAQTSGTQSSAPALPVASSSSLADNSVSSGENEQIECDPDMIGFEIITGYVR